MIRHARWALLALLPLAACSGNTPPPEASAAPPPAMPAVSSADASFAQMAAAGGLAEVQAGQLAESRARNSRIKSFAQEMVEQHDQANQQLMQIAQSQQIALPTSPDASQTAQLNRLQSLHGRAFERAYTGDQLSDHRQMISAFENEAQQGTDPQLKSFAENTLPVLKKHLAMAKNLPGAHFAQGDYARYPHGAEDTRYGTK